MAEKHRFKKGDDVTHLMQVVVTATPDSDGDYYVVVTWFDADPDDPAREMATYINKDRLDPAQDRYNEAKVMQAVTTGGIDSIEQFLKEG